MPDQGLLERTKLPAVTAIDADRAEPWDLAGSRLAQITFEVPKPAAMALMPPEVTRPLPCYARLLVLDAPQSPAGALRLAALFLGCRHMLMPRNLLVEGIVDGPLEAVQSVIGGPLREGSVTVDRSGDRSEVTVEAGGMRLAHLTQPALRAVDPTMLRWDGWLTYAATDASTSLVALEPQVASSQGFLTKSASIEIGTAEPWRALRNVNFVTSCFAEADVSLRPPRVLASLD